MRSIIALLISTLPLSAVAGESVLDILRNSANASTSILGGAESCGQVSLNELNQVECGTTSKLQGNLADISRFNYFAEDLILQDMATDAHQSVKCFLPLLQDYGRSGRTSKQLDDKAYTKFMEIAPELHAASSGINSLTDSLAQELRSTCGIERPSPNCTQPIREKFDRQIQAIRVSMSAATAKIPFGTVAEVRDAIIHRAASGDFGRDQFIKNFGGAIGKLRNHMQTFEAELDQSRRPYTKGHYYDFRKMPSVREHLLVSDQYSETLNKLGASDSLKQKLLCRRDAEFKVGRNRAKTGIVALSILSAGAGFGTSMAVSGIRLSAGVSQAARTANLALQTGLTGLDITLAAGSVFSSCFDSPTIIAKPPVKCSLEEAFRGVIARASASECITDLAVGSLAAIPAIAAVRQAKGLASGLGRAMSKEELHAADLNRLGSTLRKNKINPSQTHIDDFAKQAPSQVTFAKQAILKQGIEPERLKILEQFEKEMQRRLDRKEVTYQWWTDFNYRLSILLTPSAKRTGGILLSEKQNNFARELLTTNAWLDQSSYRALVDRYARDLTDHVANASARYPERVFLPSSQDLSLHAFNTIAGTKNSPLGLLDDKIVADGREMYPDSFYSHDFAHPQVEDMATKLYSQRPIPPPATYQAYHSTLRKNEDRQSAFEFGYFYATHEYPVRLTTYMDNGFLAQASQKDLKKLVKEIRDPAFFAGSVPKWATESDQNALKFITIADEEFRNFSRTLKSPQRH